MTNLHILMWDCGIAHARVRLVRYLHRYRCQGALSRVKDLPAGAPITSANPDPQPCAALRRMTCITFHSTTESDPKLPVASSQERSFA